MQSRSKRQAEREGLLQSHAEGCTSPRRSTLSLNTGSDLAEGLAEISSFKTSLIPCADILAVDQKIVNYSHETMSMLIRSYLSCPTAAAWTTVRMAEEYKTRLQSENRQARTSTTPCRASRHHTFELQGQIQCSTGIDEHPMPVCHHVPMLALYQRLYPVPLSPKEPPPHALSSALIGTFCPHHRHTSSLPSDQGQVWVFSIRNKPKLHRAPCSLCIYFLTEGQLHALLLPLPLEAPSPESATEGILLWTLLIPHRQKMALISISISLFFFPLPKCIFIIFRIWKVPQISKQTIISFLDLSCNQGSKFLPSL